MIILPFSECYLYIDTVANPGAVYTIWILMVKNDNNVTGLNFSKTMIDINNKIIKARAYVLMKFLLYHHQNKKLIAILSKVYFKKEQIPSIAEVRITFDGYYNGVIDASGVAAES